jgi:hypothetical protein
MEQPNCFSWVTLKVLEFATQEMLFHSISNKDKKTYLRNKLLTRNTQPEPLFCFNDSTLYCIKFKEKSGKFSEK